jgi:hypothetical protein
MLALVSQKLKNGMKSIKKSDIDCDDDEHVLVTSQRLMSELVFHIQLLSLGYISQFIGGGEDSNKLAQEWVQILKQTTDN